MYNRELLTSQIVKHSAYFTEEGIEELGEGSPPHANK